MARFNDAWMDMLLSKNDIVSLVSSYVALRSKGRRLWGLCPFHNEKTASFSVSPDKQMYYCFGCGAGGGVIQFVMEMEHLPYYEAVQFLAQRAGLELPDQIDDAQLQRERARKERLYEACKQAAKYFHEQLLSDSGAAARAYLARRGLDARIVKHFGLGYARDGWNNLLLHLQEQGFTEAELLDAGLANQKGGRVYDAYRNRVIFPIIGANARVLGFGARAMGDEMPKYINTSDTPIYNKRRNLYGLNGLKGKRVADIVIVEGYMDVISLYAGGVVNAVASLGTSLTEQQARLLKRYVSTVYIAYDGDAAGQNATLRGLEILQKEGLSVRVIVLPEGQDPDDFIRRNGKEAFDALKDAAMALNAFKLEGMAAAYDLENEEGRQEYAIAGCKFIGGLQPVERERYFLQLARKTGLSVETLRAQGEQYGGKDTLTPVVRTQTPYRRLSNEAGERELAEVALLRALVQAPEYGYMLEGHAPEELFAVEELRTVAEEALKKGAADIPALMGGLPNELAKSLAQALNTDDELLNPEQYIGDCIARIKRVDTMREIQELQARSAEDSASVEEKLQLMQQITALKKLI